MGPCGRVGRRVKYVYLGNNRLGYDVLQWLVQIGVPPAALVVHPRERERFRDAIVDAAALQADCVLEAPILRTPEGLAWLRAKEPDWLISVLFGYLLGPEARAVPTYGGLNLHLSLLPFNRGANPNVWSIVDATPAGVTLHYLDDGVDTGDIVAQQVVPVSPTDTGATLYGRLESAALALFQQSWPQIASGAPPRRRQPEGGSTHRVRDLAELDRIDPNAVVRAIDLINVIRARTFQPYRGAYIELDGRRVYLSLCLTED
jgi:methionyl-tRNA formyltransferase